jgi:hypothetical protein
MKFLQEEMDDWPVHGLRTRQASWGGKVEEIAGNESDGLDGSSRMRDGDWDGWLQVSKKTRGKAKTWRTVRLLVCVTWVWGCWLKCELRAGVCDTLSGLTSLTF